MRRFSQVDVFTATPLLGNPVAVVHDSDGLSGPRMQAFTDWTHLSEATFLAPPSHPEADYAVRIFAPGTELDFAGHPTLGSCHAWLEAGGRPRSDVIVQECGVGLVRIRRDGGSGQLSFAAPARRRTGPLAQDELDAVVAGLRIRHSDVLAHEWCDNGPPWQGVLLSSVEVLRSLRPDPAAFDNLFVGVAAVQPAGAGTDLEVRAFFPGNQGVEEDPVTGSLNAALGQWLIGSGRMPDRYVAAQGTALGRAGRVSVERVGDDVWVGGDCATVLSGTADI